MIWDRKVVNKTKYIFRSLIFRYNDFRLYFFMQYTSITYSIKGFINITKYQPHSLIQGLAKKILVGVFFQSLENEMKWIGLEATFVHIQAILGQENLLRMVRWVRWHGPPDTGFYIQTLEVWGRARYLSATEAPHNTEFYEWIGKKHFLFLSNRRDRETNPKHWRERQRC